MRGASHACHPSRHLSEPRVSQQPSVGRHDGVRPDGHIPSDYCAVPDHRLLDGYCLSRRLCGMPEDTSGAASPFSIPGTCSAIRSCPISLVGWPHREFRYTPRCRTRNNSVPRGKRSPGGPQTRTWSAAGVLGHHPALDSQQPSAYVRFSVLRMTRCPAWDADLSRPTRHLVGRVFPYGPLGMPVRLITRAARPSSRHG
jgi:hypothetical protein